MGSNFYLTYKKCYTSAMELRTLIRDYLHQAKMMQVATSVNDQPWACTVYFAFDEDFNLYWISLPTRRHSKEIEQNNMVAGTIVFPHTPGDDVRGLQFQGVATYLSGDEATQGMKYYAKRYGMDQERVGLILDGSDGHVCYKITPNLFVLFDEVNFPDDPRQELHL
jgi:uncharacterized protein YhbP (UPF0306 family)